ncbi:MAG: dTMP kinase [Rickettsiales bacterium]|nr:dTMP kinase [Rickettsiales bacterium]
MYKKKPFIVFEGIEGSGKTYHINNVVNYLKKKKIKFIKFREPGGSKNSEIIRKIILNKNSKFNKFTDLFLYLASRSENIEKIIKKNYKKKIILIDRFTDSTIAYQHYGMGIKKSIITSLNKILLNNIKPDYTFLNTVSMRNLSLRLKKRNSKNRYDNFNHLFYNKVQKGYIKLSKNKKKYFIVDSNKNVNENKLLIIKQLKKLI